MPQDTDEATAAHVVFVLLLAVADFVLVAALGFSFGLVLRSVLYFNKYFP